MVCVSVKMVLQAINVTGVTWDSKETDVTNVLPVILVKDVQVT